MKEDKLKRLLNEFANLDPDEKQEIIVMLRAQDLLLAIDDVALEVFRPARKHGYSDPEINDAVEKCGYSEKDEDGLGWSNGCELISLLEKKFYEILSDRGVSDLTY